MSFIRVVVTRNYLFRFLALSAIGWQLIGLKCMSQDLTTAAPQPTESARNITLETLGQINGLTGPRKDTWSKGGSKDSAIRIDEFSKRVSLVNSRLELLEMSHIQASLELLPEQLTEIREARKAAEDEILGLKAQYETAVDATKEKLIKTGEKVVAHFDEKLNTIILPHQWDSLNKVLYHGYIQRQGLLPVLVNGPISDLLGIDDTQRASLKKEALILQGELEAAFRKLNDDAYERIISKLSEEQQNRLKNLVGGSTKDDARINLFKLLNQIDKVAGCSSCDPSTLTVEPK